MPSETKHSLLQIARKEGRSLAQVCEILLRAEIHSYEKEGTKFLHRLSRKTAIRVQRVASPKGLLRRGIGHSQGLRITRFALYSP
jgi:hypothetical protein